MSGAHPVTDARGALQHAIETYHEHPKTVSWLRAQLDRLDEPLRVAIAGKVKAGKSTLLNALVGESIAATDAAECTRVLTWYRDGNIPAVRLHPTAGEARQLPVRRTHGELRIELATFDADEVDRLVVDWPSQNLRDTTLIDTPGTASTSSAGESTLRLLTPADDTPTEADAVIYLMRHLHATDADFLESFTDQNVSKASAVNTVAVLSRADEVGGGDVEAMFAAGRIARRYRREPTLRKLCQTVVPVAGLLAHGARTMRQSEFDELVELSARPSEETEAMLLSADRLLSAEGRRGARLLERFGLFGVRIATVLIRQGYGTAPALTAELLRRSGLAELREVLHTEFGQRRDLLKARSALLSLDSLLRTGPDGPDTAPLRAEVERILAGAHEFNELRLLSALRAGEVELPDEMASEAERVLGGRGVATTARLALHANADSEELRTAALGHLSRWQRQAESPLTGRSTAGACRTVVRTCEGIIAELPHA